nr:hypothetical protein CFP56_04438 [Quercus suber]
MSSSNSSGPPSEFGGLSIADRGSVMPPVTRSMGGTGRQVIYARRSVAAQGAGSGRRPGTNRTTANEDSDEDSSSESGEDESSDEEDVSDAGAAHGRRGEIFRLMVVFHPKQYIPAECPPGSLGQDSSDTASNYWKLIDLVARFAERNPQVLYHVRSVIPEHFWEQQTIANQRLRFDRIKLRLARRIARLPGGKGIPETIAQLRKLYQAIDTLLRYPNHFNSRDHASNLVAILVDALDYMVNDEDQFPNSTSRPTFVGNGFQSERRLAGAFLAGAGEPIGFINVLIGVRGRYSAAYLAQLTRLQEIYNRLGVICARYVTNRNVPSGERQHFSRVLSAYQIGQELVVSCFGINNSRENVIIAERVLVLIHLSLAFSCQAVHSRRFATSSPCTLLSPTKSTRTRHDRISHEERPEVTVSTYIVSPVAIIDLHRRQRIPQIPFQQHQAKGTDRDRPRSKVFRSNLQTLLACRRLCRSRACDAEARPSTHRPLDWHPAPHRRETSIP